ncbi:MAG TPA: glutamine synthetase, partial [Gaiellales bacterium]|nr:glutamine synthetase [Gaiellales bacterium]
METIDTTTAGVAELRQQVLREVGEAEIKFVRLWFTDLVGRLKSFAITRDELASALEHGMGFDGS